MKITFLGTSCGVPQKDRYCSATMVECGDRTYLIDAGAPVVELMRAKGKTPDMLSAVFITHMHGDHIDGLSGLVDIMCWYYKTADPAIFLPEISYVEPLERWISVFRSGGAVRPLRYASVRAGVIYDDGTLRVTAIPTKHISGSRGNRPTYAYMLESLVEEDRKRVLFTGDLSHSAKDYPAVAAELDFDAIVCEAAHFDINERREIFEKSRTRLFLINHAGVRISKGAMPNLLDFCSRMPFDAHVVCDGEEVTV